MSCDCKCGCDNKYISGGTQCYPLIVKIQHKRWIRYTCVGEHEEHIATGPSVELKIKQESKNWSLVAIYDNTNDYNVNCVYCFGLNSEEGGDCHGKADSSAKIVFFVEPPHREWNAGKEYPESQKGPKTTWDGGNPDYSVFAEAKRKSSSDSDEVCFEAASNPDPSSSFGMPTGQFYDLVIEVDSDGSVSVNFENAR